jgi:hypothetical protein
MRELVEEAHRCLAALVAAAEAGELVATPAQLRYLHGAVFVLESLKSVQNTSI